MPTPRGLPKRRLMGARLPVAGAKPCIKLRQEFLRVGHGLTISLENKCGKLSAQMRCQVAGQLHARHLGRMGDTAQA